MKAHKILNTPKGYQRNYNNRIVITWKEKSLVTLTIVLATPTEPQIIVPHGFVERITDKLTMEAGSITKDVVEVNLLDEKWVHPHLYKPLKDELCRQLENNGNDRTQTS